MASTAYMRLEEYRSTCVGKDAAYQGWITLDSVVFGDKPGAALGASDGASRARGGTTMTDVTLVRELDNDSPTLQETCKGGTSQDVVLDICTTMKGRVVHRELRCRLSQAVILRSRAYRVGKGPKAVTREEYLLRCAKMVCRNS